MCRSSTSTIGIMLQQDYNGTFGKRNSGFANQMLAECLASTIVYGAYILDLFILWGCGGPAILCRMESKEARA